MGTKKTKGAKGARTSGTAPKPRVILYGVEPGGEREALICETVNAAGAAIRRATADDLANPVGFFAGMKGFHPAKAPYEGEAPECEFMLLCNFPRAEMDALLDAMRDSNCSIGCKATVTPTNKFWPLAKLIEQVGREHAVMTGAGSGAGADAGAGADESAGD